MSPGGIKAVGTVGDAERGVTFDVDVCILYEDDQTQTLGTP